MEIESAMNVETTNQRAQINDSGTSHDIPTNTPVIRDPGVASVSVVQEDLKSTLKYGAEQVVKLFIPIILCIFVVVGTIKNVVFLQENNVTVQEEVFVTQKEVAVYVVVYSLVILAVIVVVTFVVTFLYMCKCYILIKIWMITASLSLLSVFTYKYLQELLLTYKIPVDWVTLGITLWNFGVLGMISIHWKSPLWSKQAYLIFVSALSALMIIRNFPDWVIWVVLVVVSLWDLFAVLAPVGPLRILIELADKRNEPLFPALLYSSSIVYMAVPSPNRPEGINMEQSVVDAQDHPPESAPPVCTCPTTNQQTSAAVKIPSNIRARQEEDKGVKLGLGDFVFYSVLVGKASEFGDWNTTMACLVAVLVGLCLTLILLATCGRALPALPISITFGLIFYFTGKEIIKPFHDMFTAELVFI